MKKSSISINTGKPRGPVSDTLFGLFWEDINYSCDGGLNANMVRNNVEAAYSTVNSLADKLGLGLGGFAMGAILELGKFDGTQAVQADSALFTIKMLYTAIPAAMMVIALVFLAFYNVEKKLKEANV